MSNKVKDIDIKNRTYYFFNDIINMEKFNPNNIKMDEKSYKKYSCLIYWICDDQRTKYIKIYSANPLYLIFNKVNGCFEEITGNKYLKLVHTNESKEKNKKDEEL